MKTLVVKIDRKHPAASAVERAASVLREGGVVVIPTDTVYGLAANAFDREAQKKIYRLKGRSFRKPLIIMPPDAEAARMIAEVSRDAAKLMRHFWPGPLTLVLPATRLGKMLMGGRSDLGLRVPADPLVRSLVRACGFPIATTSANPSAQKSAVNASMARNYFDGKADMILDAGPSDAGSPSTVIDMLRFPYVVLREGCLNSKKLLDHL